MGEGAEKAARMSTRAFRGYVFGLQMGIFYVSMFTSSMMMAESAQLSLQDAQENYQRTLQEFGPAHEKTQAALRRVERAQIRVDRMWLRTGLTMGGLILQTISYGYTLAMATGVLGAHTTATATATAVNATHTAGIWAQVTALKAWIIAQAMAHPWLTVGMLAAGAVAAGAVGYYLGGAGGGTPEQPYVEPRLRGEVAPTVSPAKAGVGVEVVQTMTVQTTQSDLIRGLVQAGAEAENMASKIEESSSKVSAGLSQVSVQAEFSATQIKAFGSTIAANKTRISEFEVAHVMAHPASEIVAPKVIATRTVENHYLSERGKETNIEINIEARTRDEIERAIDEAARRAKEDLRAAEAV